MIRLKPLSLGFLLVDFNLFLPKIERNAFFVCFREIMSAKAISEYDAKRLVAEHIKFDRLENKFKAVSIR